MRRFHPMQVTRGLAAVCVTGMFLAWPGVVAASDNDKPAWAPLEADEHTVALWNFNNGNIPKTDKQGNITEEGYEPVRVVEDASGNGHNGQIHGDPRWVRTAPPWGQRRRSMAVYGPGLRFDGRGDYVQVPDSDAFHLGTGDFTLEVLIAINRYRDPRPLKVGCILAHYDRENRSGFRLNITRLSEVRIDLMDVEGNRKTIIAEGIESVRRIGYCWIKVIRSGDTVTIYLNGKPVAEDEVAELGPINGSGPLYIGSLRPDMWAFGGVIDDLRISKVARSVEAP